MADTPKPTAKHPASGRMLLLPTEPGLDHPSTLVAPAGAGSVQRRAVLTILAGSDIGRVLDLSIGLSVSIGRRATCSYRIEDPSVSGLHARITSMSNLFVLSDERSTNGTFVNGVRMIEPRHLADGDRIHLGRVLLRFSLVDEAERMALKRMYEATLRDTLTTLFNRKHLDERLESEIAFSRRHKGHELSVIMLDVDHFKAVNDTHGHLAGDAVLRAVAAAVIGSVRTDDFVARYGGEEFVIVARDIAADAACAQAERVRETIAAGVVTYGEKEIRVTASAGVSSLMEGGELRDRTALLAAADRRLYVAKREGRNRVIGP